VRLQATVAAYLRAVGVAVSPRDQSENETSFSFVDFDNRYEFSVGIAAQAGRKVKWVVRIAAQEIEDAESIATLKRLPALPTSEFVDSTYTRWSPFTVEAVGGNAKRVTDWIVGTIANAADRMLLNTERPSPSEEPPAGQQSEPASTPVEEPITLAPEPALSPPVTDDVVRHLVDVVTRAADPRTALFEALAERGLVSPALEEEIRTGIRLEQGDPRAILEAARRGTVLTAIQAQVVVRMAFAEPNVVSDEVLFSALEATQAGWDEHAKTLLRESVRDLRDLNTGLTIFKLVAKAAPSDVVGLVARGLVDRAKREAPARKRDVLVEIVSTSFQAGLLQGTSLIDNLLGEEELRPYDIWSDPVIRAAISGDEGAAVVLHRAALAEGTEPDLRVACQALVEVAPTSTTMRSIGKWLKRWVEKGHSIGPADQALFEKVASALQEWHCNNPMTAEASADQLSLQRLVQSHPEIAQLELSRAAIENARRPGSPEAKQAAAMNERFEKAKRYVEQELVGKNRRFILFGSRPNKTSENVLNQFYPMRKFHWIEWLETERGKGPGRRVLSDKIKGASCVAVIVFTGASSHRNTGLTDILSDTADKQVHRIESSSRDKLTIGLVEVIEKHNRDSAAT
jgi:hypothetical protein